MSAAQPGGEQEELRWADGRSRQAGRGTARRQPAPATDRSMHLALPPHAHRTCRLMAAKECKEYKRHQNQQRRVEVHQRAADPAVLEVPDGHVQEDRHAAQEEKQWLAVAPPAGIGAARADIRRLRCGLCRRCRNRRQRVGRRGLCGVAAAGGGASRRCTPRARPRDGRSPQDARCKAWAGCGDPRPAGGARA